MPAGGLIKVNSLPLQQTSSAPVIIGHGVIVLSATIVPVVLPECADNVPEVPLSVVL